VQEFFSFLGRLPYDSHPFSESSITTANYILSTSRSSIMFIPTFFTIAAAIISLFTLVNAHPIAEPRSLLGRQYRDVRVRRSPIADLLPRRIGVILESAEPVTRSDRFLGIQRRHAELGAHVPVHSENLLSNQSFGAPPAKQTPMPIPSPSPPSSHHRTPVEHESNSTSPGRNRGGKHSGGKKVMKIVKQ